MKKQIQVIDLFCGAGGLSWGFSNFRSSGVEFLLLGGVDLNQPSLATYRSNIEAPTIYADLGEIARSPKKLSNFVAQFGIDRSLPLIVIGGPPCQGFSAHSKKLRKSSDSRNNLVAAFAKIAVALKPDMVAFENVPEAMTEKNWHFFEPMVRTFKKAGMHLTAQVHNLAEFGVPQERFRALLIAAKTTYPPLLTPTHTKEEFVTVRETIGSLPKVFPGENSAMDSMHFCANHRQSTVDVISQVPVDGGNRPPGIGPACLRKVDGYRDVYGRLAWDKPAVTITASARNPASGRFSHPEQNRGLTVREAALLQGFPPNYLFYGSFDEKFLQIGNAVPPVFSMALAKCLAENLIKSTQTSNINSATQTQGISVKIEPLANSFSSALFALKRRGFGSAYETK